MPYLSFRRPTSTAIFNLSLHDALPICLRAKLRFPPSNIFNSNGDGTYSFKAGVGAAADDPVWNFEWSVNTDYNSLTGDKLSDVTYRMEIDDEQGAGTKFLAWDHISSPT